MSWRAATSCDARLIVGAGTLGVLVWAEQAHAETVARTMGVVTYSLYALFFSFTTRDERRTIFSLDTFSDKTFLTMTATSILTLFLSTVFGPLQAFLKMTNLDIIASEMQKAITNRMPVKR